MEAEHPTLSSASSTLADVAVRIEQLAETLDAQGDEALAADLYEVERSLRMAVRRLEQVVQRLR